MTTGCVLASSTGVLRAVVGPLTKETLFLSWVVLVLEALRPGTQLPTSSGQWHNPPGGPEGTLCPGALRLEGEEIQYM